MGEWLRRSPLHKNTGGFGTEGGQPLRRHRCNTIMGGGCSDRQKPGRRAAILAEGERVTARDLELTDALSALPPQTVKEAREGVEREMVQHALRRHKGKITSAALELGVSTDAV
jgi:transcriptional regulator with GAF, ATPase, and Fis domain